MHIIGQSRVDTGQTAKTPSRSTKSQLIHRPMQIEGRSRIDTWQVTMARPKISSTTEVTLSLISI